MERVELYNLAVEDKRYIDAAMLAAEIASEKVSAWNRTCWVWEVAKCLQAAGIDFTDFVQPLRVADIACDFSLLFDQLNQLKELAKKKKETKK